MDKTVKGLPPPPTKFDGSPFRIAIVHARWNDAVIKALVEGAVQTLKKNGVKEENIVIKTVPGSYELPFAVKKLIEGGKAQATKSEPSLISNVNLLSMVDDVTGGRSGTPAPEGGKELREFDAVIAIGVLIKGSTMHFEYICDAVSHGLMRVGLDSGTPVIFGVLTALTDDQALERAGIGRGENKGHNHGEDWGLAAVEAAAAANEWGKGHI